MSVQKSVPKEKKYIQRHRINQITSSTVLVVNVSVFSINSLSFTFTVSSFSFDFEILFFFRLILVEFC